MQQIKANIVIEIPEEKILLDKVEYQKLQQKSEPEWVKGLDWLSEQTGIQSPTTLRENVLYPNRKELEKTCVDFPDKRGEHWYFNVTPMKKWLKNNFSKVVK